MKLYRATLLFCAVVAPVHPLCAQGNLGGLTGNVVDPSGALIPEAKITLRNIETNAVNSALSGAGGYTFRALPPGTYHLEAEKSGFKKSVRERVTVLTATTTTLDIVLEVGTVSESVTVSGDVVALQTASPEVGTVLQRQALLDLPIQIGGGASTTAASGRRQPETFIFLTPGVSGTQWSKSINGNPDFSQEVLIDGVSAQLATTPGFLAQTSPPYEAVDEFKVQNTLFPAEYGRGFGVINYTLKSGTNQYHGDLFEFLRNDKFDARPFFNRTRPIVRFNEYGGFLGGPVVIPKIYNGKDRTFFNFNYTGLRNAPPLPGNLVSVPPQAFKNGDFSSYTDASGAMIPIYDPMTTQADGTRAPFPGNMIPSSRFSKVGQRVLNLIPNPDLPGYFNNYINRTSNPTEDDLWSLKADQIITANQRFSFTWWSALNDQSVASALGPQGGPLAFWQYGHTTGRNYRFNYSYSIRPTLLWNMAYGYTKSNPTRQLDTRKGNEILQIPGVPADAPGFATFNISTPLGGISSLGNSDQQPNDPSENAIWSINGSVTWIRGKHQWKFGGENRILHYNNFGATTDGGLSGVFNFNSASTANLTAPNSSQLGNGYASLLLGEVYSAMRLIPAPQRHMQHSFRTWFVEDTIKATRKLTLTLGFRHELPTVVQEKDRAQSYLDLSLPNPGAGGRPGALAFLEGRNALLDNYHRAFSPRIGVAYSIDDKTVIRSGFGIFFSPTNATNIGRFAGLFTAGLSYRQDFPQLFGGRVAALSLDNGFPPSPVTPPIKDPTLQNNGTIDYINPGAAKPGYNSSWTLNIQRELPGRILLDAGYVGQRGTALPAGLENINQVGFDRLGLGNLLLQSASSPDAVAAGIRLPYPGFTGSVLQALRPYPQFTGIRNLFQPIGWSTYNSFQLRVQKQYSNGLSILVAYTFSKAFVSGAGYTGFGDDAANAVPIDTNNRKLEKRLAGFDIPQNLILSWTYELPFGRGKRYLGSGGALNYLVGGWQVNAIQRYASGTPFGVGGGGRIPVGGGSNRPVRLPGVDPRTSVSRSDFDPARDRYLNIAAFANTPDFVLGTAAANYGDMRVFGMRNEDFSVLKSFTLHEQHRLQFRAEFFNIFNKVVFGGPSASVTSPASFGVIGGQANEPRHIQLGLKYLF